MILYDWVCKKKHSFEEFSSLSDRELVCPTCGGTAIRQVSTPRAVLEGVTGDFPDAAAKWEKMHTPKSKGGEMPT